MAGQLRFSVVKLILGSFTPSEKFDIRLVCRMHTILYLGLFNVFVALITIP